MPVIEYGPVVLTIKYNVNLKENTLYIYIYIYIYINI